jgi:hypothetical protein
MFGRWRKPKKMVKRMITKTKMVLTVHMGRTNFQRTFHDEEFDMGNHGVYVTSSSAMAEKWMIACGQKGFMWDGNKIYYPWSSMTKIEAVMTEWKEEIEEEA